MIVNVKNECFKAYNVLVEETKSYNGRINDNAVANIYKKFELVPDFDESFMSLIGRSEKISLDEIEIDWSLGFTEDIEFSFPKENFFVAFARDYEGNSFHLLDTTKADTPVIYNSHDPYVLLVASNNICEFLKNVSGKQGGVFIERLLKSEQIFKANTLANEDLSLNLDSKMLPPKHKNITEKNKSVVFDFSRLNVGEGIRKDMYGPSTKIKCNFDDRTINISSAKTEEIHKYERENIQTKFILIGVPVVSFVFFLLTSLINDTPISVFIITAPLFVILATASIFFIIFVLYSVWLKIF